MQPAREASWLHLSDLDCPPKEDAGWEDAVRDTLLRWQKLRPARGFDVILVSGNVTRDGSAAAFSRASRLVGELRRGLGSGAPEAVVLAVPGEHDMTHEAPGEAVAERASDATFAAWRTWWRAQLEGLPSHALVREGEAPGDFSATVTLADRGLRVGVVGLNTLTGHEETSERPPVRLGERLRAVCGRDPAAWSRHHHVAVLLTRHLPWRDDGQLARWAETLDAGIVLHHGGRESSSRRVGVESFGLPTEVVQAWSFAGYHAEGVAGLHRTRPQGGAVVSLELRDGSFARLLATELDTTPGSSRPPEEVARRAWLSAPSEAAPESLPPPVARSVATDVTRALSSEEVTELLWALLPGEADFRGFTFSELREAHRALPQDASREVRTKRLLARCTPEEVVAALGRYLPGVAEERVKALRASRR